MSSVTHSKPVAHHNYNNSHATVAGTSGLRMLCMRTITAIVRMLQCFAVCCSELQCDAVLGRLVLKVFAQVPVMLALSASQQITRVALGARHFEFELGE